MIRVLLPGPLSTVIVNLRGDLKVQILTVLHIFIYFCVCMCACHDTCVEIEENFQEDSVPSFDPVGPGGQTQAVRLGSKCPYLMHHLINPLSFL